MKTSDWAYIVLVILAATHCGFGQSANPQTPPSSPANDDVVVLTASQASGGVLKKAADGGILGVMLNRSCEANFAKPTDAAIDWPLSSPLTPGWWHVQVESGQQSTWANRNLKFVLVSPGEPSVPLAPNYAAMKDAAKSNSFECWLYTMGPATQFRAKAAGDLWRYIETWPINRVTLRQHPPVSLTAADAVCLALSVKSDGKVALPATMPPGNYIVTAVLEKKQGKDPGSIIACDLNGRTIEVPLIYDRYGRGPSASYLFLDQPVVSLSIRSSYSYASILLEHRITDLDTPTDPVPDAGQLMTTVDSSRTQRAQLELIGAGLNGAAPTFPLFPQGKKIAVLTSWDDGKPEDLRCAEILHKYGYHPSFFLNDNSPAMKFLDKLEAMDVEVGSHCFHHPSLYALTPQQAAIECVAMRRELEQTLKHPVISFAYPNGYFPSYDVDGDYVLRAVTAAGYWSGRTTRTAHETVDSATPPLVMNTDGFFGNAKDLERTWEQVCNKDGAIFYFWGHSWQIGKTEEHWRKFDDFVAQFARQPQAWYPSQGELSLWLWARGNVRLTVADTTPERVTVTLTRPWLHPWLAARCPLSFKMPPGVTQVIWQGKTLSVSDNGTVDLIWGE